MKRVCVCWLCLASVKRELCTDSGADMAASSPLRTERLTSLHVSSVGTRKESRPSLPAKLALDFTLRRVSTAEYILSLLVVMPKCKTNFVPL